MFIAVDNLLLSFDDAKQFCREQYDATLASNLSLDDYSGLFDSNITANRGFRIGLVSENNICRNGSQPSERPYYWYNQPNTCVNGSPLMIQNDPSNDLIDCQTVQILVSQESETLPMARLLPCNARSRFICQTTDQTKTASTTTIQLPIGTKPSSESVSPLIFGATIPIGCAVILLLIFLMIRRIKRYKKMQLTFIRKSRGNKIFKNCGRSCKS